MTKLEESNKQQNAEEKVGVTDENMEVSRPTDAKTENNISKNKQTNSK